MLRLFGGFQEYFWSGLHPLSQPSHDAGLRTLCKNHHNLSWLQDFLVIEHQPLQEIERGTHQGRRLPIEKKLPLWGVPLNHPFLDGIFPYEPSILGYPHGYGNPNLNPKFWLHWYNSPVRPRLSLPRCTAAINITVPGQRFQPWDVMVLKPARVSSICGGVLKWGWPPIMDGLLAGRVPLDSR